MVIVFFWSNMSFDYSRKLFPRTHYFDDILKDVVFVEFIIEFVGRASFATIKLIRADYPIFFFALFGHIVTFF